MFRSFAIALGVATVTATSAFAPALAQDVVKVGVAAEPYAPFTSQDASGKWVGWEVDMMEAICGAAELNCEITPVAWDGIIPALESGKIDAIMSSMSITEERSKRIDFSNKYYNPPAMLVIAKGSGLQPTDESLAGKNLGVQVNTTHAAYAKKHFPSASIREYQTQDEISQDLSAGRLDATNADSLAMTDFLKTEPGQACCESAGNVPDDPEVLGAGVGVGVRKDSGDLLAKFNEGIAAVRDSGKYKEITDKYFEVDIYGG